MNRQSTIKLLLLWFLWAVIILGFQQLVIMRFLPVRPDRALPWTPSETASTSQEDQPYLVIPFMNSQVSWDSEFYLAIADKGYDNPDVRTVTVLDSGSYSLNYAFFPLFPNLIKVVAQGPRSFGMAPMDSLVLSAVLISLLGTFAGMLGLFDLSRLHISEQASFRTVSYLLIFPTAFFFAQAYSEGLFIGLAFPALALAQRRKYLWAAILMIPAVLTRAIGVAFVVPMIWFVIEDYRSRRKRGVTTQGIVAAIIPALTYLLWTISPLGKRFWLIEEHFFSRGILKINQSLMVWKDAITQLDAGNTQTVAYYSIEFAVILLAFLCSVVLLRRSPALALFSLAVWLLCIASGVPQSMNRYVLTMPAMFITLGKWGENEMFDRTWTAISVLLLGLLTALFTFDFWVG